MKRYNPQHEVIDTEKVESIVEAIRTGEPINPIAVNGENALTGVHRMAAFEVAYDLWESEADGWESTVEPEIPVVEISDDEYVDALESLGYEVGEVAEPDVNDLCEALHRITLDEDLKSALADQF